MIIKAEKPKFNKLDGGGAQELEGVIDVSLNIGTSANAGTASMSRATELFDPTSPGILEVGGLDFYCEKYGTSVNDGPGGRTYSTELIDGSFRLLDRFYIELNPARSDLGVVQGNFLFLGQEYYSYTYRDYKWNMEYKNWEPDEDKVAVNNFLSRGEYVVKYSGMEAIYKRYQEALHNIEAWESYTAPGAEGESISSACGDNSIPPNDTLLLSGGAFAAHAQTILNFQSMPNPTLEKGEMYYRLSDIQSALDSAGATTLKGEKIKLSVLGAGEAIFNQTGTLRAVISAISGQVGKAWYWDPAQDNIDLSYSGEIDVSIPNEAVTSRVGETMSNSYSDGMIYRRTIPGQEWPNDMRSWTWRRSANQGNLYEDILDALDINEPSGNPVSKEQVILYTEIGEEAYKAFWIFVNQGNADNLDNVEKKVIKQLAMYGDESFANLFGEGYDRDGVTEIEGDATHDLTWYNIADWNSHIDNIREEVAWAKIWKACGPDTSGIGNNDERGRFGHWQYSTDVDPTLLRLIHNYGSADSYSMFYPLSLDVVSSDNDCLSVGSASIHHEDDKIKDTPLGGIIGSVAGDSACSDKELMDKTLHEALGLDHWVIFGDNGTWSYDFPECTKEAFSAWVEGAVVEPSFEAGPLEFGESLDTHDFVDTGFVAVKKKGPMVTVDSDSTAMGWSDVLVDVDDLITASKIRITAFAKIDDILFGGSQYEETMSKSLCSSSTGVANWGIQNIESNQEISSAIVDQVTSFGGAKCKGMTDFCSYALHGQFDTLGDDPFRYLDSLSITFGAGGITASYSKSEKKAIPPSALLFAGVRASGMSANINLGGNISRMHPKVSSRLMGFPPPAARRGKASPGSTATGASSTIKKGLT